MRKLLVPFCTFLTVGAVSYSPILTNALAATTTSDSSAIVSRYKSVMSKANSRNIVSTMANYSLDFYNQGYDYYDAAHGFTDAFVTPGYLAKLSNLRVTYTEILFPYGYMEAVLHVKETVSGFVVSDADYLIAMYFVKEGTKWLCYGDQSSFVTSFSGQEPFKGFKSLSSQRK